MDADLDTLATALYVTADDFLADNPQHRPWRPKVGLTPRLSDAESDHAGSSAGTAGFYFRGEVAALRQQPSAHHVSLPAHTIGL